MTASTPAPSAERRRAPEVAGLLHGFDDRHEGVIRERQGVERDVRLDRDREQAVGPVAERHPAHELRRHRDHAATRERGGMERPTRLDTVLIEQLLGHEQLPEHDPADAARSNLPDAVDEHRPPDPTLARRAQAKGRLDPGVVDAADGWRVVHPRSMPSSRSGPNGPSGAVRCGSLWRSVHRMITLR